MVNNNDQDLLHREAEDDEDMMRRHHVSNWSQGREYVCIYADGV